MKKLLYCVALLSSSLSFTAMADDSCKDLDSLNQSEQIILDSTTIIEKQKTLLLEMNSNSKIVAKLTCYKSNETENDFCFNSLNEVKESRERIMAIENITQTQKDALLSMNSFTQEIVELIINSICK